MDDGAGGSFSSIVGFSSPYALNSYIVTTSISSGATYRFKYRASNVHGFGDFSPISSIQASTVPGSPG